MIVSYAPNWSVTYDRKLRSQTLKVQATGFQNQKSIWYLDWKTFECQLKNHKSKETETRFYSERFIVNVLQS